MDLTPRSAKTARSIAENEPLSRHTTWRIGGPARFFCRVRTEAGLARRPRRGLGARRLPLALLGMGSNILVADDGFPGYVLRLEGDFLKVAIEGERLTAGGGAALGGVCAAAARAGLSGIEAISGIPSSIGGAVRINAGAYGGEIFDVLETRPAGVAHGRAARGRGGGDRARLPLVGADRDARDRERRRRSRLRPAPREEIEAKTRTVADKRRGALPSEPNAGQRLQEPGGRLRRPADRGLRPEGRAQPAAP